MTIKREEVADIISNILCDLDLWSTLYDVGDESVELWGTLNLNELDELELNIAIKAVLGIEPLKKPGDPKYSNLDMTLGEFIDFTMKELQEQECGSGE